MLTDFDLSKQAATSVNPQVIKKIFEKPEIYSKPELVTNSFVGTAEYIAPEVIQGYGQSSSVDWWTFGILMYEMLYGVTPHRGKTQQDTFNQILNKEVKFPEHHQYPVSNACKSLIKKLLTSDPKKRLGSAHGAADVKKHKFFEKLNFTLIRNIAPPMVPKISSPFDTSNFRNIQDSDEEKPHDPNSKEDSHPKSDNDKNDENGENGVFREFTPITRPNKSSSFLNLAALESHFPK